VHRNALLTAILALLIAGCGQRPPGGGAPATPAAAPAAAAARADAIRAAAAGLPSVTGNRDGPGGTATWRAFFAGDDLRLLEESLADPPRPPLENRYYFERGELFYYAGEQAAQAGGGAEGAAARVPVLAEFQGARALRAVRIEHYGEVRLEPAPVEALQRRAAELASAARDEHSARRIAP
jgi:hypothetical protein